MDIFLCTFTLDAFARLRCELARTLIPSNYSSEKVID